MASEKIRVGIIGAGRNTKSRHIPGLQALMVLRLLVFVIAAENPRSVLLTSSVFQKSTTTGKM